MTDEMVNAEVFRTMVSRLSRENRSMRESLKLYIVGFYASIFFNAVLVLFINLS